MPAQNNVLLVQDALLAIMPILRDLPQDKVIEVVSTLALATIEMNTSTKAERATALRRFATVLQKRADQCD